MTEVVVERRNFEPQESINWPEDEDGVALEALHLTFSGHADPQEHLTRDFAYYDGDGPDGTTTVRITTMPGESGMRLTGYAGPYPGTSPARRRIEIAGDFPDIPWPPTGENDTARYDEAFRTFTIGVLANYADTLRT